MKIIAIAGGLLASAVLLTGCGLDGIAGPAHKDTVTYQVKDKVQKLHLRSGSGDVAVTESDVAYVSVTETLHWSNDKPRAEHKVAGDTLSVYYDCQRSWGSCGVDYQVEIPKGLQVDLDAGSGDLTLRSLTGPLDLKADSGDIKGNGLGGKRILAEAESGNIDLRYAVAPDSVELSVDSGDAVLTVPDGSYDVSTRVDSGDEHVSVKDDNSSPHKISVTADSGDVTVSAG
ncbi:DUF4097 family beta strand repeat protein [Nonomuraea sp. SMC257]|uniref:DUF4097 family beta strand repeat protein n=1 Tax=Nonomuraea montanisoli TaxID=2741721 RepID=A0A7Y6IDY8_9ACTN|nr:DUF4097 family beta strand repeat-containing protein [Nonomuraea montanisoli]NUW35770.1 DUF4097 family beta strand repeat protein [Nonomuraea montanisoli]